MVTHFKPVSGEEAHVLNAYIHFKCSLLVLSGVLVEQQIEAEDKDSHEKAASACAGSEHLQFTSKKGRSVLALVVITQVSAERQHFFPSRWLLEVKLPF